MVLPANLDGLSHTELKNLVVRLFEQLAEQQRTITALSDEIAAPFRARPIPSRANDSAAAGDVVAQPRHLSSPSAKWSAS